MNKEDRNIDIRNIREQLHLTQKAFAERLHISLRTLQGWESGKPVPETMLHLINQTVWMEETMKEHLTEGEYELMNQTINRKIYTEEEKQALIKKIYPNGIKKLSPEEKERRSIEVDCDICNTDLKERGITDYEFQPFYTEDAGWVIKRHYKADR